MDRILTEETLAWLLEKSEPGVRYLAMRDLLDLPVDDPDLTKAREKAHAEGPIAAVLENIQPEGYWEKTVHGYLPKYRSTVWALILLGQLGASVDMDMRIERGCRYLLDHALTDHGQLHHLRWAWRHGRLPAGESAHRPAGPGILG